MKIFCISIIAPCYNEEKNLNILYNNIVDHIEQMQIEFEIIFVDDGSTDGTKKLLQELSQSSEYLKPVYLDKNAGQTYAIKRGIEHASSEYIVILDADLQHCASDIPRMLNMLHEGYDLVCGWRFKRQDSGIRLLASYLANLLIRFLFKTDLHDIGCTLKCCKKELFKDIEFKKNDHRYFPLLFDRNIKIMECKIKHFPRIYGASKYDVLKRTLCVIKELFVIYFFRLKKVPRIN